MTAQAQKLARLVRLERVRAIARQTAASATASAESKLAQVQALATRSRDLAADYNGRADAADGAELRRLALFANGLQVVCRSTGADAVRAQGVADLRQNELANAELRRAAAEARVANAVRDIAKGTQTPVLSARRKDRAE